MKHTLGWFAVWLCTVGPMGFAQSPDTTPPTVSILSPLNHDRVGGKITVTATVTDNVGVETVTFLKQGKAVATAQTPPFAAEFDFNADAPDKDYDIEVKAEDHAHNSARAKITVNKPRIDLRGPGGNLADNGAFFKVWAPHASQVSLIGDFNNNNEFANYLWRDGEWFFGFQPGAMAGQKYQFRINGWISKPDPFGREMTNSAGWSLLEDPARFKWTDGAWKTPRFEDMIIYELHVGTFVGKNDGQHYAGNLRNLLSKLDYIKSTGANMIEMLPLNEVPGPDGNTPYLGYSPTGIYAVESSLSGGQDTSYEDLQVLVNTAHSKGLGVIFDVVYNHFSDITGRDNWYWNYDGFDDGRGGIFYSGEHTDWGGAPNWSAPQVRDYVEKNARYWLTEFHGDGLRWDATTRITDKNNGKEAIRSILGNIRRDYPDKLLVAEHLPYDSGLLDYVNFHSGWWVDFNHKIKEQLKRQDSADLNEVKLGVNGGSYGANIKRVIYAISHDEARNGNNYLVAEFGGRGDWNAQAKARVAAALMLASPGIPMIWQGEEFANDTWFDDNYNNAVNWLYERDAIGEHMKKLYCDATANRWQYNALRDGGLTWTHEDPDNKVLAFRRDTASQSILVVVNFGSTTFQNHTYGVSTGKQAQWSQILCSQDSKYGGWDGAGNAFYDQTSNGDGKIFINVPKLSVTVFRQK